MKSKWIIIALSLLLIVSVFFHVRYMNNEKRREKAFLRTAYFYITRIVSSVDRLDEYHSTGIYDDLNSEIGYLLKNIYTLDQTLKDGHLFVDDAIWPSGTELGFEGIGLTIEGELHRNDKKYLIPFTEDGKLSENEAAYLNKLSQYLKEIKVLMTGKPGKISENISISEFSEALGAFFKKWENYYKTFPEAPSEL